LKVLELEGYVVSIDAIGCQNVIADQIIESKANYLLAVKGNQEKLHRALEDSFCFQLKAEVLVSDKLDFGHGRIEKRTCYISKDMGYVDTEKWKDVKTLIKVVSERYNKAQQRQEEMTVRYYISSFEAGCVPI
jgi:Transposase